MSSLKLPDFLIAGNDRSGTDWIKSCLQAHPNIHIPNGHIFYFSLYYDSMLLEQYSEKFKGAVVGQIVGEHSTNYIPWDHINPHLLNNIQETIPNVKFIISLRNPVDYILSRARWQVAHKTIDINLEDFDSNFVSDGKYTEIRGKLSDIIPGNNNIKHAIHIRDEYEYFEFTEQAKYVYALRRLWDVFPRENSCVIILEEDVYCNPKNTMKNMFKFLGVDSDFEPKVNHNNNKNTKITNKLSHSARLVMIDYYKEYNEELFTLLGRRVSAWLE